MKKYTKLKKDNECAFPERDNCNYDETKSRCKFMKYNNSKSINDSTRWEYLFKKEEKQSNSDKNKGGVHSKDI